MQLWDIWLTRNSYHQSLYNLLWPLPLCITEPFPTLSRQCNLFHHLDQCGPLVSWRCMCHHVKQNSGIAEPAFITMFGALSTGLIQGSQSRMFCMQPSRAGYQPKYILVQYFYARSVLVISDVTFPNILMLSLSTFKVFLVKSQQYGSWNRSSTVTWDAFLLQLCCRI